MGVAVHHLPRQGHRVVLSGSGRSEKWVNEKSDEANELIAVTLRVLCTIVVLIHSKRKKNDRKSCRSFALWFAIVPLGLHL